MSDRFTKTKDACVIDVVEYEGGAAPLRYAAGQALQPHRFPFSGELGQDENVQQVNWEDIERDGNSAREGKGTNKAQAAQVIFFIFSLVIGLVLTHYSDKGPLSQTIAGEVCFGGGWIPLVGTVLTFMETKKIDEIKTRANGLALILVIFSLILFAGLSKKNQEGFDGWLATFGLPLLESAVIYMVQKFLFIEEGDAVYIDRLEATNKLLESSMVNGVADGFFFNFIKKIGLELKDADTADEADLPNVQFEKGRGNCLDAKMKSFKFNIFIPLSFPYDGAADVNPIENFMRAMKANAVVMKSKKWGRPAFFKSFVAEENPNDKVTIDQMFDMPTAMSVLRENVRDEGEMEPLLKQQCLE